MFDCITSQFHIPTPRTFEFSADEPDVANEPAADAQMIFQSKLDDIERRVTALNQVLQDEIGKLLAQMAAAVEEFKNAQYGRQRTDQNNDDG